MKRMVPVILISFFMIFASLPINAQVKEGSDYDLALASVIEQLEDQDALRFLPVYEEILKKEFHQTKTHSLKHSVMRASSSSITLNNGGHIYYPNYLGYNVSVSEVLNIAIILHLLAIFLCIWQSNLENKPYELINKG